MRFGLPFDLKLVSVKFEAFGLSFPTLNLGFYIIFVSSCSHKTVRSTPYLEVLLLLSLLLVAGTHDNNLVVDRNLIEG